MSQQKGICFKKFRQRFQTEEACEAYLFQQRWPDGFVCPICGRMGCYRLRGCREYVCKHCHRQSSVAVGTVLHRTHLPLTVWFWAIYLVARDKRDISATQLSRELEIAYSSAWYLLHRLRKAMGQRDQDYVLSGIVELDDAYFGAPKPNGKWGREQRKPAHWQRCPLPGKNIPVSSKYRSLKLDAESVSIVVQRIVRSGNEIHSDALRSFRAALREGYVHHYQVFDKNSGALRWVHALISNLKSFLLGTYHGLGRKHLQSYFDEFSFRFNRCFWPE